MTKRYTKHGISVTWSTPHMGDSHGHTRPQIIICHTLDQVKEMMHGFADNLDGSIEISVRFGILVQPDPEVEE